jgi:hypothetical protein
MPFIPDNTGLQQLINVSSEQAQKGVAGAFDTAYQHQLTEQANARQLYETLTKTLGEKAPGLVAMVAAQNPHMLAALTSSPTLNTPKIALGAQVSEAFAKAQSGMSTKPTVDTNEMRLLMESGQKMIQTATANGAKIADPEKFINGYAKAISEGRPATPADVGLSHEDFARVLATPEAKNIDPLSSLVKMFKDEHGRDPSFEDMRTLISFVLPGTDEKTIALTQALRESSIKEISINMQRASEALNDARNGQKLTAGQMVDINNTIATNRPIIAAIQKIDSLWDAARDGDKKARKAILFATQDLVTNDEARTAVSELVFNKYDATTRKYLTDIVKRRIPLLNVAEKALATGRQPRGGTEAVAPSEVKPEDAVLDELRQLGLDPNQP